MHVSRRRNCKILSRLTRRARYVCVTQYIEAKVDIFMSKYGPFFKFPQLSSNSHDNQVFAAITGLITNHHLHCISPAFSCCSTICSRLDASGPICQRASRVQVRSYKQLSRANLKQRRSRATPHVTAQVRTMTSSASDLPESVCTPWMPLAQPTPFRDLDHRYGYVSRFVLDTYDQQTP